MGSPTSEADHAHRSSSMAHDDDQDEMSYSEEDESYFGGSFSDCYEDDDNPDAAVRPNRYGIDRSMELEDDERQWALDIKRSVEESTCLANLTDMEYVHYAIVCEGNTEDAIKRIERMQWLRNQYRIDNSVEQGVHFLTESCKQQRGALLQLDMCPVTGEGILAWDSGSCYPARALECSPLDTEVEMNWKIHAGGCYYLLRSVQPTFQSIREGAFCLLDGHDVGWENISMVYERRMHYEVLSHYPITVNKIMDYNTNSVAVVFWSLMKKLLPKRFTRVVEVGCRVEFTDPLAPPRTLRDLYLQPSIDTATCQMMKRASELLAIRAKNEAAFRL